MTKRELIEALIRSSVEDWAPVLVETPDFPADTGFDHEIVGTTTIHTNKRQEVIIRIER